MTHLGEVSYCCIDAPLEEHASASPRVSGLPSVIDRMHCAQGLDDAKPILQATPVSLAARHFDPLAAAMKVAAPAKRHKSGSIVGIGSFLSIASADSGGPMANGSLAGLAHSGTKILGNVLHDLHVVLSSRLTQLAVVCSKYVWTERRSNNWLQQ